MRWWIVAMLAAALASWAGAAPRPVALGFDHLLHERDVDVSGADALACARCHVMQAGKLVGKPAHAACFGACHGAAPIAPARGAHVDEPAERVRVCTACHAEAALAAPYRGTLAVPYPPYVLERDYALTFGHRSHRDSECARCHTAPDAAAAPRSPTTATATAPAIDPHRRCAICHTGGDGHGPAMSACTTCHAAASGRPRPPALADTTITVTSAFSHARHAARGGAGNACVTCHAAIRDTDDNQLPRPTAATCAIAGCHDHVAAFGITDACARCHRDPPTGTFRVWRPDARFSHAQHRDALAALPCAACHPVDTRSPRGELAIASHAACATCHAADFGAARPTICGACHTSTEPWRPLTPDQRPADRTEFGATLDHRKHPGACTSCHALTTAAEQLRPPRGHLACVGAGCHAFASGPAPHLDACTSCHQPGAQRARELARTTAVWSTRAAFDHAAHATARDGQPLACTTCHTDLAAPDVRSLPAPTKATCAPCHDGTTAFSLTGTTCTRCHATVASPTAADGRHD